jgi:hypothetical protein
MEPIPEPILEEEVGKNRRGSGKDWVDIPNPHLNSIENIKIFLTDNQYLANKTDKIYSLKVSKCNKHLECTHKIRYCFGNIFSVQESGVHSEVLVENPQWRVIKKYLDLSQCVA